MLKEVIQALDGIFQAWQSTSRTCHNAVPELIFQLNGSQQYQGWMDVKPSPGKQNSSHDWLRFGLTPAFFHTRHLSAFHPIYCKTPSADWFLSVWEGLCSGTLMGPASA